MTTSSLAVHAETPRWSWDLLSSLLAFVSIGASGAAAFVALSTAMISINPATPAWLVSTGCYGALILPVYLLHRRFSFRSGSSHRHALPRYVAVQCMALVLTAVFALMVHGHMSLPTLVASMLVVVLTSGINFIVLRSWAFAGTRAERLAGFQ